MNGKLLIPRGDTTKLFKTIEESLDQVARLVAMPIIIARRVSIRARWNNRFGAAGFNPLYQGIAVIAFVGQYGLGIGRHIKQGIGLTNVGLFGAGQGESERIAECIDTTVDFGSESATRATQSLWAVFFLAPAACWWARIAVLSNITSSRSRSWLMT